MMRLRGMIMALLMMSIILAGPISAFAILSGDPRREENEIKVSQHGQLIVHEYNDGSYWVNLPVKDQSLMLKSDGSAVQFSRDGEALARGTWDKNSGEVKDMNELSFYILSEVKGAIRPNAEPVNVPALKADAPSPVGKGDIEWVE